MSNKLEVYLSRKSSNITNNTSEVEVTVKVYSDLSWSNYDCDGYVTLDGTKHTFKHTFSRGTTTVYHGTHTVKHNADGTKTVKASASFTTSTSLGTLKAEKSLTLKTIPRATTPKLSHVGQSFGYPIKISLPAHSDTFVHRLSYKMLGEEGIIQKGVTASFFDWTIPSDLMNKIPNRTAVTMTIVCETFSNGNSIGKKSASFTARVPSNIIPTANVTFSEAVNDVKNKFGAYLQGESRLNVKVTGTQAYSSPIKAYSCTVNGITYNSATFTSDRIKSSGQVKIVAKVTDSRGRTGTVTKFVNVTAYKKPDLISITSERCNVDGSLNDEGDCIKVYVQGSASNVKSNTKSLKLRYKKTTETAWQEKIITLPSWKFDVEELITNTVADESYNFEATLTDALHSTVLRAQTGKVAISLFPGGKGVRIFGEAFKEGFYVNNTKIPFEITKKSATKSIPSGSTYTTITEIPVSAGSYAVFGNLIFNAGFKEFKTARITLASGLTETIVQSVGNLRGGMSVSDVIQLDVADTIRLQVLHGASGAKTADGSLKVVKII